MIIDRNSRPWVIAIVAMLVVAIVYYFYFYPTSPEGPRGSSVPGLVYGSVGSAMMLFAMALSLRKRLRRMRLGRTFWWTQGHVWLGLLSYPLILFHAGFHWGGTLTQVIMWLFTIIVVSGIVGIALQNLIPKSMLRDVQMETIYEQIGHVADQLQGEARTIVQTVSRRPEREAYAVEVMPAGGGTALLAAEQSVDGAAILTAFYEQEVKPFLVAKVPKDSPLRTQQGFEASFAATRQALPPALHQTLSDLQSIVEERRQIEKQRRLHIALHCWLLVHVPLSFALLVLGTAHAVVAMRYT